MKEIAIIGTGYVGLVTGTCLSEVGHCVTCIDVDEEKIDMMNEGKSPIYEPQLEHLMTKNMAKGRLSFKTGDAFNLNDVDLIFIAVGTPQQTDGSVNLTYVEQAAEAIAKQVTHDVTVVIKSTVPVGTNEKMKESIQSRITKDAVIQVVSNPEFLREGSAVYDMFHGDRIVIGAEHHSTFSTMEEVYASFQIPILKTDPRSAEMIKYSSNAFLANKISFINEIAAICEKLGANIEDVAQGMGLDTRIGTQYLNPGIGYGGSCFPKDTKALIEMAGNVAYPFELLKAVVHVNNKQPISLINKAKKRLGSLYGKRVAVLGLAFKPNTDDVREAASIVMINELLSQGAIVQAYDPMAIPRAKKAVKGIHFVESVVEALADTDVSFIATEWSEFKELPLTVYEKHMNTPIIFDGRNCYALDHVKHYVIEYHSIGRPIIGHVNEQN